MVLSNGREFHAMHPEVITLGEYALIVYIIHPSRQLEVIDTTHIASIRTAYAVNSSGTFKE